MGFYPALDQNLVPTSTRVTKIIRLPTERKEQDKSFGKIVCNYIITQQSSITISLHDLFVPDNPLHFIPKISDPATDCASIATVMAEDLVITMLESTNESLESLRKRDRKNSLDSCSG